MKEKIDRFLACSRFAVAGVSRNKNKFGSVVFRELKKKEYNILPVNPNMESFDGEMCYRSVSDLPSDVEALIIATRPETSLSVMKEAIDKGIKNIFLQQGAQNPEVMEYAERNGANLISRQCILMFARPSGIHKFHACVARFFGFYPN
jgi:uncharacterized protein